MTGHSRYNIAAIRELLLAAFTADDLRRLFLYTSNEHLKPLRHQFSPGDGLEAMVEKAIIYCQIRSLLPDLLKEVEQTNPRMYAQFEPRLVDTSPALAERQDAPTPTPVEQSGKRPHGSLLQSLRDPVWQGVAALIGIVALVVAFGTWFWPDIRTNLFPEPTDVTLITTSPPLADTYFPTPTDTETATATPTADPSLASTQTLATPFPTGEPPLPSGYELYDSYEGGWDTSLWQPPYGVGPCEMARENGELKIDCDDRGVESDAFVMTISAKELAKNSILHGVAMAAVNEGNNGITNLAVTYIDASGEEIGAYFMNLGPAQVEVWEVTDLNPDNWQQHQLGKVPISESPWHVLQIEFRESGLRFLVDRQEIDLGQPPRPPAGADYVDWKIEGFVCQDQVLNARVAWAAWNASQR